MHHPLFLFALPLATLASLGYLTVATAQITPDNSLGAESSVVTPNVLIKNVPSDQIDGGATRGANLFHSFQEFNINAGRGAYFSNPQGIANILTRVTGGNFSNIQGVLGVLGSANLFLINPNGIIFGPNARLDVGGSFLGSTANSLIFKNGFEFSATNPQAPPLLTINVPIGLGFRDNPQNITSQSAVLGVPQGNSLALVGGNVSLNGGGLVAQGGRIELGGLSAAGTVGLNTDGSLNFPVGVQRADVSLTNRAGVLVSGGGGGNIAVNARNLDLLGGSLLLAGIQSGLRTPGAQAGDIKIDATDRVRIEGTRNSNGGILNSTGSFSSNSSNITEPGNAGNVVINTGTLEGNGNILIGSTTNGEGNAGKIIITAKDKVSLTADANSFAQVSGLVGSLGTGNGADIVIDTPSLSLFNTAILSGTSGQGNAGNIQLKVSESISLGGDSQLAAGTFGRGNAGNIVIDAPNAAVSFDGGLVSTFVGRASTGKAGDITVKARNLSLNNGVSLSTTTSGRAEAGRLANAGNIQINVLEDVSFKGGSDLNSSTSGQGNAGNVTVSAGGKISFDGRGSDVRTGIFSYAFTGAEGNAGNIELRGRSVEITNGAVLRASTSGKGDAGSVRINATDTISFAGVDDNNDISGIFSDVRSGAQGKGGNIELQARSVSMTDGAQLSVNTSGKGDAGSVKINATDTISFSGANPLFRFPSGIFSNVGSGGEGKGGNIELQARSVSVTNGAQLVANTLGKGDAGSLRINATDTVSFSGVNQIHGNPSAAFSTVEAGGVGNGGEINITAGSLELTNGGQLNAFVRGTLGTTPGGNGNAGNIKLDIRNAVTITGVGNNDTPSRIFSDVRSGAVGNAGNIEINARSLSLTNGGTISTTNLSNGTAGNITVTTAKDIRLDNKAFIEANTRRGQGNISLNARDLILRRNSNITTNATGTATGGNITINTANLVALENSNITANAQQGYGGNIIITTTGGRFLSPDSVISATSEAGPQFNGTVQFNTPQNDPSKGLFEFPETVTDPAQQIAQNVCTKGFGSSFTITGRGGVPTDPKKILSSDNVRVDLVKPVASTVSSTTTTQKQPSQKPPVKEIIPARGWIYNEKGEVLLVGYDPTKTGPQRSSPAPTSNCAAVK